MRNLFLFLPLVILAAGCKEKKTQSLFEDKCPLSYNVEWVTVESGVEVEEQIELLSKLSAAAKADADKLNKVIGKAQGEVDIANEFQLSKELQSQTVRKAHVSQDVFDEFVRMRAASCNIWDGIQNGIYGDDEEALKKAREMFTDLQKNFAQLEKKKRDTVQVDVIDRGQLLNLGNTAFRQQDYQDAKQYFNEYLRVVTTNDDVYSKRGYCNLQLGLYDAALSDFDRAITINPDDHKHYSNRGLYFLKKNDFENALADYEKAIQKSPVTNLDYINKRGWARYKLGKADEACEDFRFCSDRGFAQATRNYNNICK